VNSNTKWLNFLERVGWTCLQVVSADGLVKFIDAVWHTHLDLVWVAVFATVLAAIKNAAAQAFGSPTGSTLPFPVRPVPAEGVAVKVAPTTLRLVASNGLALPNGTPVTVSPAVPPAQAPVTPAPPPPVAPTQ